MNDADSGTAVDRHTDHARDVIQVTFCEALCTIEGVDPDDHLLLKELVGELIVVVVGFWCCHTVDLLHLLQVLPVAVSLHVVVLYQHLLTNMVLVEFIRHDIGPLSLNLVDIFVFFANNGRPWV